MKLQKKAEENTRVVKNKKEVLKEGTPLDHSIKHDAISVIGVNVGLTKNMSDYNSLRVDCWLTDTVKENETQEEAYSRVLSVVDKTLRSTLEYYSE